MPGAKRSSPGAWRRSPTRRPLARPRPGSSRRAPRRGQSEAPHHADRDLVGFELAREGRAERRIVLELRADAERAREVVADPQAVAKARSARGAVAQERGRVGGERIAHVAAIGAHATV